MSNLRRRYPGVTPFETSQADQYFGRRRDVQDLFDMILLEKLVVLFGKSGYGKSSLLNAGIIPRLLDIKDSGSRRFIPIVIKFYPYTTDTLKTPVEIVKDRLGFTLGQSIPKPIFFQPLLEKQNTLWFDFKSRHSSGQKYVLIFDQFEEFFTYPQNQQAQFRGQLAELLYTEIPQFIRDSWDLLSNKDKEAVSEELNIRAIFAIREDRLGWLNSLKESLPAILHKRYELRGMADDQAREAILKPAALDQDMGFEGHSFSYSEEALDILLAELKKGGGDLINYNQKQDRIEAFLLQICCENIETRLIERAKKGDIDTKVDPEDLPRFDRIYEEYYNSKINDLPEDQREIAKRLLEDELVSLNEKTGVVFRLNADGRRLCDKSGVTEDLLKKLTNSFLLRSEPNTTGGFNYEISHDTLVAPVLKAKEIRLAEERRMAEERTRQEKEKELAEEKRKRRRATVIAAIGILLALTALVASFLAFQQRNKALDAQNKAEKSQLEAEAATKIAEERLRELQREKATGLIQRGDSFFQNDEFGFALSMYQEALKLTPDDLKLQEKIRQCKALLNGK